MTAKHSGDAIEIARAFQAILDRHGYGFQYAALREINRVRGPDYTTQSPWDYEVLEFPVEVQSHGTRIDFILKSWGDPFYMVVECKRVNPAFADWCFAKAPYTVSDRSGGDRAAHSLFVETLEYESIAAVAVIKAGVEVLGGSGDIVHIAQEIKTGNKGDAVGKGRGAIEEAATQVCRGVNGLIDYFVKSQRVNAGQPVARFLPVIFTTARLWVSSIDLSTVSLGDGKIDVSEMKVHEKGWVFYHYVQSPGLKHEVPSRAKNADLGAVLYREFVRTIAIVNGTHIGEFLTSGLTDAMAS